MKLPSKELLSEVLGIDVNEVKGIEANTPICGCVHSDGWYDEINIYELAHKCKEWAYEQEIGKTGTYYNGCGRSKQQKMYEINIVTKKQYKDEYIALIDNGKDLNCALEFYGLSGRNNSPEKCFNRKANKVNEICFYADTEPEVIFKACEWIMEQIKCGS